jgi:N-acetylneuraminic acid mutarotase
VNKSVGLLLALIILTSSIAILGKPAACTQAKENSWVTKAPIPQAIPVGKAAVVDGKIYVIGGLANYQYDPATDNWTTRKPMPTARTSFGIAVYCCVE